MSVLVVCPVSDTEALRIFLEGAAVTALNIGMSDLSTVEFEIRGGRGESRPVFRLTGGAA